MKSWKEFSSSEKRMVIVIVVLLLAILLTTGRVKSGVGKSFERFFSSPVDTIMKP